MYVSECTGVVQFYQLAPLAVPMFNFWKMNLATLLIAIFKIYLQFWHWRVNLDPQRFSEIKNFIFHYNLFMIYDYSSFFNEMFWIAFVLCSLSFTLCNSSIAPELHFPHLFQSPFPHLRLLNKTYGARGCLFIYLDSRLWPQKEGVCLACTKAWVQAPGRNGKRGILRKKHCKSIRFWKLDWWHQVIRWQAILSLEHTRACLWVCSSLPVS